MADNAMPNIAARNEQAGQIDVDEDPNMVQWRGNLVSEKEAKALRHVYDNLQDHFGHQRPDPRVRFNHESLAHPGHGQKWHGDVDFTYDIDGDHCNLNYIGMDVCVDLAPKLVHKHGQPMLKDHGRAWLYVYLPQLTIDKVKSYVKAGTGWDVSDEGFFEDPNRNLVAIEANLNHQSGQPEPSFWVIKDKDASGGGISFSRIGSVQEVAAQSHQQRIHRGVGIFTVSMEVEGTPNFEPTPGGGDEAKLSFTLVSVRTWGITDCVAPIVYAPSKWHHYY
eukprot:scaffold682_cov105-Skeletonema_dohrnii-CCMP3373.AAC.4